MLHMLLTGFARLGRDAELRYTSTGTPIASLWLAYDHGRRKDDGNHETQWLAASIFGETAERLAPYLTRGAAVHVVCRDPHVEMGADGKPRLTGVVVHIELAPRQRDDADRQGERQGERAAAQMPEALAGLDEDLPF